jgi:GAF domain-containing protein
VAAVGLSEGYVSKGVVDLQHSAVDQEVLQGATVAMEDVTSDPRFQYPDEATREGLCGMVAIPLQVRSRTFGVLRAYCGKERTFAEDEILLLRTVADLGAIAIEKAQLHAGLYRIADALNASMELQEMLERVLECVVTEMRIRAASVRLLDQKNKELQLVAAHGLSEAYLDKGAVEVKRSPIDQKVLSGEHVTLLDVAQDAGYQYPEEAAQEGIRSVLAIPLQLRGHTIGVMRAYSAQPRRFGPVGTDFLMSVADLAAVAIENARMHQALKTRYEDLQSDLTEWYRFLALG